MKEVKFSILFLIVSLVFLISLVSAGWRWDGSYGSGIGSYIQNDKYEDNKGATGYTFLNDNEVPVIVSNGDYQKTSEGKTITLNKGGKISIKGNEYNVKTDGSDKAKFVFNNKAELTDGTKFVADDNTKYRLKGYDVPLVKGTEVLFKDGKVILKIPENGEIKSPEKIDKNAEDIKLEYTTDKDAGFVISDGNNKYKIGKGKGQDSVVVGFDGKLGKFYIDRAKIDSLDVGGADTTPKKTYLFFDGERHDDFTEPYLSLGNENNKYKISVGSPKGKVSASVEFLEGNKYGGVEIKTTNKFIVQSRGGSVTIEDRKTENKIPKVTTRGNFYLVAGNQLARYEDGLKGVSLHDKVKIKGTQLTGFTSSPMELESLDTGGNRIVKKWDFYITDEKIDVAPAGNSDKLAVIGRKGTPVSSRLEFYQLSKDERAKFAGLDANTQKKLISLGSAEKMKSELGKIQIGFSVKERNFNPTGNIDGGSQGKVLQDIRNHRDPKMGSTYEDRDPVTTAHETTHGINNMLRGGASSDSNAFYLLNGKYVVLKEPSTTLDAVRANVPDNLKNSQSYNLYLVQQSSSWNNQPLYVMDELTAYTNGGMVAVETGSRSSMNIPEFMTYSLALGETVQQKDPSYWKSANGQEFKNFLGYSLERSMRVNIQQTGSKEKAVANLKTMTNPQIQQFTRQTYGADWTKRVLGF